MKDAPSAVKIGNIKVSVTNTYKVFWPQKGFTKGDVINYYQSISQFILPHLKDRPLSLKRNPNGIKDKGFYHKDAGEDAPSFVKVFSVKNKEKVIDYIVCNNEATLVYLANLGCIEMNPWNNRFKNEHKPDWFAIDLDPGDDNTFSQVIEVAQTCKKILDKLDLTAFCKTSGASGIHIYVPLKARYDYEEVKSFGQLFMQVVEKTLPGISTLQRIKKKRGKRIYLDYLQNNRGQTLASVYSIRPVEAAAVSTPIEWKELNSKLDPTNFTIKNTLKRLQAKGDLFKDVLTTGNDLAKAKKLLQS